MNPVDLAIYAGALTGVISAVVAWWKYRGIDKVRLSMEARDKLIDQLQEEYKRLTEKVETLETALAETRALLTAAEARLAETERGRDVLRQRVDELVQENAKLHRLIEDLSTRVRKQLPELALERMRVIAAEIAELYEYVSQEYPDELIDEKVTQLLGLVTGIPALIER